MRKAALAAIGEAILRDHRVVFVGSDLGAGTMSEVANARPDQVFMEGIAEQHILSFSAGLALEGFIPFVHTISTFIYRRALEQIIVDLAIPNLPVTLVGAGGGMVYAPLGPTHDAVEDFAITLSVPGLNVLAPGDPNEVTQIIEHVSMGLSGPSYLRLGKGGEQNVLDEHGEKFVFGSLRKLKAGSKLVVITTGSLVHGVVNFLFNSQDFKDVGLIHVPCLNPLNETELAASLGGYEKVLILEEHIDRGGLGDLVRRVMFDNGLNKAFWTRNLGGKYPNQYGSQDDHYRLHGLDSESLRLIIEEIMLDIGE